MEIYLFGLIGTNAIILGVVFIILGVVKFSLEKKADKFIKKTKSKIRSSIYNMDIDKLNKCEAKYLAFKNRYSFFMRKKDIINVEQKIQYAIQQIQPNTGNEIYQEL